MTKGTYVTVEARWRMGVQSGRCVLRNVSHDAALAGRSRAKACQAGFVGTEVSREPLIAVIDDDGPFRAALVEALLSFGYEARGFASAEEFVMVDRQVACNCVITDIHMPGMSGLDLKRLLTTLGSAVPVIMITARTEPDLETRAAASGAVCLLRKPFEIAALLKCLKRALDA